MKQAAIIVFVVATYFLPITNYSQEITLPSTPAFSILNYEPSAVMRPTNVKSLSSDILNSFDKSGRLNLNIGLEVAPYWLKSRDALTLKNYLQPNLKQTFLQSLSFSAATVKDSASGANKLGVGFRFKLYNGIPAISAASISQIKNLKIRTLVSSVIVGMASTNLFDNTQVALDALLANLNRQKVDTLVVANVNSIATNIINSYSNDAASVTSFLNQLNTLWIEAFKDLQQKVSASLYQRKGVIVELAGANAFATNNTQYVTEKTGLWVNVSYHVNANDMFTFTTRYQYNKRDTLATNIDAGMNFYTKSDKFALSFEAMLRYASWQIPDRNINNVAIHRIEKKSSYRVALQCAYKVNDLISFNISLGKDFEALQFNSNSYFSLFGFNYSLFSKQPQQLQK